MVCGFGRAASAHPLDIGYLRVDANEQAVTASLDLDVNAAALLLGIDADKLDVATLHARATELSTVTFGSSPLATETGPCTWSGATAELRNRTVTLVDTAHCPPKLHSLRWTLPFVTRVSTTFQLLVKIRMFDVEHVAIVDRAKTSFEVSGASATIGFIAFVKTGVEHIGVAPDQWRTNDGGWKLPDGIDHIMFLLALMLSGGRLIQLIGIASGFTLGHSITLALSALNVVRPPSSVIEPLIALSIAFVAGEAIVDLHRGGKFHKHRWKVASCFGLIHGFGFANALNDLDLSAGDMLKALFGYNLGVELGQLAIVLVTAPVILVLQRYPRVHPWVVRVGAACIFTAGMYWFLQRLTT